MNITLERAREYFRTRTTGEMWDEYSSDQKQVALAQARRDLSRALGRAIKDDEPEYREGDRTRDEFAVYEQALYSLLRDARPKGGGGSAVPPLDQDGVQSSKVLSMCTGQGKWSKEALAWLAKRIMTEVVIV